MTHRVDPDDLIDESTNPSNGWRAPQPRQEECEMENLRTQVFIQPGEEGRTVLPFSEVCMHMRVAGKPFRFRFQHPRNLKGESVLTYDDGTPTRPVFQILNENGSEFSFPILYSEGGVYHDGRQYYYYPAPKEETNE